MAALRAGIIGLNGIAVRHVMDIEAHEELRLGAVCDTDTELGLRWQGEHDAPWYKDYRDINRSEHCDFVIVALPHYLHAEVACDALEAGKPVIIQKPMCITVEEADRIIATAQRTGTKVATFHTAHLVERDARALIDQGVVGDVLRVHYARQEARSVAYYGTGPWRGHWATEGRWDAHQPVHPRPEQAALPVRSPSRRWSAARWRTSGIRGSRSRTLARRSCGSPTAPTAS